MEEIAPPRPSPSESRPASCPASSSHLESSEYEDAVSNDESAEDASSFLRLGTILEALAEYLVPQSVQQASPTDWVVGLCMVAVLSHAAIFRFLPGVLQEVAALREVGFFSVDMPSVPSLSEMFATMVRVLFTDVDVDSLLLLSCCQLARNTGRAFHKGANCLHAEVG